MIRKHTRRAAKAAFAISLGVAIVIGLFAAAFARPAHQSAGTDDRHRHEELRRGVHPRPALQAGARGEGLQGHLQGEHRLDRADPDRAHERQDQHVPGVHGRDRAGRLPPHAVAEDGRGDVHRSRSSSRRRRASRCSSRRRSSTPTCVAVTNATAKKYGLKSIGDLKKAGSVQVRRLPGVQDAEHVLRRLHEAVRAHERDVRPARRDLGVRGARRGQGARRRRVLDRPAARQGARSTRCSPTRST